MRPILPQRSHRLALATGVAIVAMALGAMAAARLQVIFTGPLGETAHQQLTVRTTSTAGTTTPSTTQLWTDAVALARQEVDSADEVLTDSEDMVADDAVRLALAAAILQVRSILGNPPTLPSDQDVATLIEATTQVTQATTVVAEAQTTWQTDRGTHTATAAPVTDLPATEEDAGSTGGAGGAGPDCGGPESYEPPKNDNTPVFRTSTPTASGDGSNGRMPASALSPLGWCTDAWGDQQWLRKDAADALTSLNEAFSAKFGENIAVDMGYRSYDDQVAMREYYGRVAALPGTSNHGTGLAIDVWEWQAYSYGSRRYDWLVENAPDHGWESPSWARQGGSNPEYWHFEYVG